MADPLVLNVAELLRRPATRKAYELVVPAVGMTLGGDAEVPDGTPVVVDVVVESLSDGLTVNGEVRTTWTGTCRRCLGPATGELVADVQELYQVHPTSEEAFASSVAEGGERARPALLCRGKNRYDSVGTLSSDRSCQS